MLAQGLGLEYNRLMRLYLVRHGRTDAYLKNIRQSPDSVLGEVGIGEAKKVAKRLKDVEVDVLISSHWPRAKQTAEIIAKERGDLEIVIYPDLHEQEHSPSLYGAEDQSEIDLRHHKERSESSKELNFDWKFEGGGESLNELLVRANKVKKALVEKYNGKKVIAVSHGTFMAALLTSAIFGDEPDKKTVIDFFGSFRHHNAGLSILDYDEERGFWSLISFNDHSHLA